MTRLGVGAACRATVEPQGLGWLCTSAGEVVVARKLWEGFSAGQFRENTYATIYRGRWRRS